MASQFFLILGLVSGAIGSGLWSDQSCQSPFRITDRLCCHDDHCSALGTEKSCMADKTCFWSKEKRCELNVDERNDVCCSKPVNDICHKISNGICPWHYEVPIGCCEAPFDNYKQVLKVSRPGHVCCSAPCDQLKRHEKSQKQCEMNEERKRSCDKMSTKAPTGRSALLGNIFGSKLGFKNAGIASHVGLYPYSGFGYNYLPQQDEKVVKDVEEITADHVIDALIEALSNEQDVFQFSQETHSDPYRGNVKSGGHLGSFSFIEPDLYLNRIYGSPFGLNNVQYDANNFYGHNGFYGHNLYSGHNTFNGHNLYSGHGFGHGFGQGFGHGVPHPGLVSGSFRPHNFGNNVYDPKFGNSVYDPKFGNNVYDGKNVKSAKAPY